MLMANKTSEAKDLYFPKANLELGERFKFRNGGMIG